MPETTDQLKAKAVLVVQGRGKAKLLFPGNGVEHTGNCNDVIKMAIAVGMLQKDDSLLFVQMDGSFEMSKALNYVYDRTGMPGEVP